MSCSYLVNKSKQTPKENGTNTPKGKRTHTPKENRPITPSQKRSTTPREKKTNTPREEHSQGISSDSEEEVIISGEDFEFSIRQRRII